MLTIDYTDYTGFQDYIKNNFIIDYADCTDILTTLTTLITLLWKYAIDNTILNDYVDIQE